MYEKYSKAWVGICDPAHKVLRHEEDENPFELSKSRRPGCPCNVSHCAGSPAVSCPRPGISCARDPWISVARSREVVMNPIFGPSTCVRHRPERSPRTRPYHTGSRRRTPLPGRCICRYSPCPPRRHSKEPSPRPSDPFCSRRDRGRREYHPSIQGYAGEDSALRHCRPLPLRRTGCRPQNW